jgi:hypothetical protein
MTELVEILSNIIIRTYKFVALGTQEVLEKTTEEDCAKKRAKGRN